MLKYRQDLKEKSRALRRNMTDAEQALWFRLRRKQLAGIQFYRQKPIGNYVVDFYAPSAKLVVELDGSQHMDEQMTKRDAARSVFLEEQGLAVLRFDDRQALMETGRVLEAILAHLPGSMR
jgi:very-short-patch-repair endonuclease